MSLAFATRLGAGISPDSTVYVDAANNLKMGRGLSVQSGPDEFTPLTHFPPLFPALLALLGSLGFDASSGARWLNVLLFGGNIFLLVAGNATNRALVFHPLGLSHARGAVHTLAVWLLPESVPNVTGGIIALIVVASAILWFVLALRQRGWSKAIVLIKQNCEVIPYLFFAFAIVYLAFLVLSISFVDAATSLNLRTMTPVCDPGTGWKFRLYGPAKTGPDQPDAQ